MCSLFAYPVISAVFVTATIAIAGQATIPSADESYQKRGPTGAQRTDSTNDRRRAAPSDEDKNRFRDLKRSGWQLAKLLNVSCGEPDIRHVVTADENCRTSIPGNGTSFSFRTGTYCPPALSDVKLREGLFISGSKFTLGMITDLGDVVPGTYFESDRRIKFVEKLAAANTIEEAREQTIAVNRGIVDGETLYAATAPVRVNGGYAIRSIAYQIQMPATDKRVDMTAVFSVVRTDEQGDVTILWKPVQIKLSPILRMDK